MTDVSDKPTTSPISTRKHGDVLIILSNNPPVNALGDGGAAGAGRRDRAGRSRRQRQGGGHRLRRPDLLRRRGHHRVRQAAASSRGFRRSSTRSRIAASRWSRRSTARRSAADSRWRSPATIASRAVGEARHAEVKLGLLPGAGGTQRLPRVAGVRKALEMCATGNPIGPRTAFDCGLVDRLIEDELIPHAVGYAEEVRDVRPLPKSSRAAGQDRRMRSRRCSRIPPRTMRASSAASRRR